MSKTISFSSHIGPDPFGAIFLCPESPSPYGEVRPRYNLNVPIEIILAGPNGGGKTTFAREFLRLEADVIQFVNADLIAAGISPFAPQTADVVAGRIMIERLKELSSEGVDFALETTLSGNWLVHHIRDWQTKGYTVDLYYLTSPSPEFAVERVAKRVREGGHFIPEDVIHRRFHRSLDMLERKYKPLVDRWMVYDNREQTPRFKDEGSK